MKKQLEISFYTGSPKIMIRWCTISETWCTTDGWTHRQTYRQTEKVTYRGGCPIYNCFFNKYTALNIKRPHA